MTKSKSAAMRAICERRVNVRDVVCAWLVALLISIGTAGASYGIEAARHHVGATQMDAAHQSTAHRAS
jgi:hypothetical protein